jgi:arabinofuranosyltransferase
MDDVLASSTQVAPPVDTGDGPAIDGPRTPERGRRTVELGLMAAVTVAVLLFGWLRRWTSDDAFINFRVVENLLAGNGPVFSAPERIEVATSPLWLFVLTAAEAVVPGANVAWASVILGLVLTASGVVFSMLGARRLFAATPSWVTVPFGAVVFAALPPTWDFTTSGLETGMSFAWIGLSFWGLVRWAQADAPVAGRPVWLYVLLGLGPLVRPDFAIISLFLLLWLTVVGSGRWWQRLLGLVAAGLAPVAYQVFRMGYYGLLIPNTAVAKESSRPLWGRGAVYLADLIAPHLLWVPAVLAVVLLAVLAPQTGWRKREWSLVAVVLAAAAVHALYVVRVGGDFMHARLLMPSLFLALAPVAAVPLTRRRLWAGVAVMAATAVWAVASVAVLRTDYERGVAASGIADERGFYAGLSGEDNPITLEEHGGAGVSNYTAQVNEFQRDGEDVIAVQVVPVGPDTPVSVIAPSSGGVIFSVGNAGFYGVAADLDVFVVDGFGLTDPVGSHIEAGPPGRPGHEKIYPAWWLMARFGAPELATEVTEDLPAPDMVAAARAALACGDAAELVAATGDPLTWDRFWDNVTGSPHRTSVRIPVDPFLAEEQFC